VSTPTVRALRFALAFVSVALVSGCTTLPARVGLPALTLGTHEFRRTMEAYGDAPVESGNDAHVLLNGDELFPAILDALRGARRTITYAQYYWDRGAVGRRLAETIGERCRAGVAATVLLDGFGTLGIPEEHRQILQSSGCRVETFHPLTDVGDVNHRNHQRILVVDGRVGFTGGWGVGARWTGNGHEQGHWRETDVRIRGPVVHSLQSVFVRAWADTTGMVLGGDAYFPPLDAEGTVDMQVIASDPQHGMTTVYTSLLLVLSAARRSLLITTPYFVPDDRVLAALLDAVRRGVRVQLLLAGPIDWNVVRAAGRHDYGRLLRAGIGIYEYRAGLLHTKTLVADGVWASVGSANMDVRSLGINRELNLAMYDPGMAARLTQIFHADLERARRLDEATWRERPVWRRLFELLSLPLRGLL
jgi:cardiolipin synthase A/B